MCIQKLFTTGMILLSRETLSGILLIILSSNLHISRLNVGLNMLLRSKKARFWQYFVHECKKENLMMLVCETTDRTAEFNLSLEIANIVSLSIPVKFKLRVGIY